MRWYDVGGIDPAGNPGVYAFKKGLNGVELSELGVFEHAPHRAIARGVALLETLYRRLRLIVPARNRPIVGLGARFEELALDMRRDALYRP